jgi:ATP-dependent RNA helicase DOB1
MGINMPARTVVFTASRKFDGTDFRWISPGEYIQMSGRAGRRGLDDRGIVIQMIDEKMEPADAKNILKGTADPLNSAFHLGYNMLLNLMRVEDADPERMMALSFHQFQSERAAPAMEEELARVAAEATAVAGGITDEPAVAEYYALVAALEQARDAMKAIITRPEHALPFLQPGRLVRVVDSTAGGASGGSDDDWGWGVVVNFQKRPAGSNAAATALGGAPADDADGASSSAGAGGGGGGSVYVVDVLLPCATDDASSSSSSSSSNSDAAGGAKRRPRPRPWAAGSPGGELKVVPVLLPLVAGFSSIRVYIPKDLRPADARAGMWDRLKEVQKRFPAGLPLLDPVEDMQIGGDEFKGLVGRCLGLQTRLAASPLQDAPDRDRRFELYKRKVRARARRVG